MVAEIAKEIEKRFSEIGISLEIPEIESRLKKLIYEFGVPEEEARRSVINYFKKEYGIAPETSFQRGDAEVTTISQIDESGKWISLRVKVLQLWEPGHESISQVGLVGDETGTMKFTKWKSAGLPDLVEGRNYLLKNVVTDEWRGRYNIKLNRNTKILEIDEEIEVGSQTEEIEGIIASIREGSGIIKRCPICNRKLFGNFCGEHGEVRGVPDFRIRAVIDDGERAEDIILNREMAEKVLGITFEKARKMEEKGMDLKEYIKERLMGRYYRISGANFGGFILADRMEEIDRIGVDSEFLFVDEEKMKRDV
ncbi:MAG: replication factor A [Candidatus Syntropharchaeia archaeon]